VSIYYASVPRGPLLELNISGPDGKEAFLLPRIRIAEHEAALLKSIASDADLAIEGDLLLLLTALLGHSMTADELAGDRPALSAPAEYLTAGFGRPVPADVVKQWVELDRQAEAVLARFADSAVDLSPTEHPLLGLTALIDQLEITADEWWEPVDGALRAYVGLLSDAAARAEPSTAAWEFINSLADYGRNYDLIATTEVPLDRPFVLKYSERRDFALGFRGTVDQDVVLADAVTNHVVLAVTDANVQMRKVRALGPGGGFAYGAFTTRQSTQTNAIYAHELDRDYRVTFRFRLVALPRLRWTAYAAAGLLAALTLAVLIEAPHSLRDLAVIVGPISLAASVLLIREPTTLSSRLRRTGFALLATALALLLLVSALSYLGPRLAPRGQPAPVPSSSDTPTVAGR
jgi:hypothetical protein